MTTLTAPRAKHRKPTKHRKPRAIFFQGKIGSEDFRADFVTHSILQKSWLLEGTQRHIDGTRTIVVFKYLTDREELPSGRYWFAPDDEDKNLKEERFSVIVMQLNDVGVPAYTAERGGIEFFHDEDTNHVNGALNVTYRDADGFEVLVQMLFSN